MSELVTAWQSGHFTETEIVEAFNTTYLAFRQALRNADLQMPKENPPGLHAEIYFESSMGVDERYNNTQLISESYGIPFTTAYRYRITAPTTKVDKSIPELLATGLTQVEVASMLKVSQATVSNHNPKRRNKPKGRSLTEEEWEQLLASRHRFSISELARLYKVSRAQIYARLKKC